MNRLQYLGMPLLPWYAIPPAFSLPALTTFVKLVRAAGSVAADVHRHLALFDLTVSQFGVLEALYHNGPTFQRDIAAKILKTTGNITLVIDNLEKRDLVLRQRELQNRRSILVSLTEKGRELIQEIFPQHAWRIGDRMAVWGEMEQRQLGLLLKKLGQGISAEKKSGLALKEVRNRRMIV
jgi:MarR family transcriptional regulator, 2-MHQ and catechol-resistance regulon repressor